MPQMYGPQQRLAPPGPQQRLPQPGPQQSMAPSGPPQRLPLPGPPQRLPLPGPQQRLPPPGLPQQGPGQPSPADLYCLMKEQQQQAGMNSPDSLLRNVLLQRQMGQPGGPMGQPGGPMANLPPPPPRQQMAQPPNGVLPSDAPTNMPRPFRRGAINGF